MLRKVIGLSLFAGFSWAVVESVIWLTNVRPTTIDGGDLLALVVGSCFLGLIVALTRDGYAKEH